MGNPCPICRKHGTLIFHCPGCGAQSRMTAIHHGAGGCRCPVVHTRILIEHAPVANVNKIHGGWIPMIWENGHPELDPWRARSLDKDDAAKVALRCAEDRAALFLGDYCVTIREAYCGECGQIGCTHDGFDREET